MSLLCKVITCILLFVSIGLSAQQGNNKNDLPEIGVVASEAISLDKEMLIGDAMMRQLRGQAPVINDPLLEEYIQDLGNRLVAQAEHVKFPFSFFLINSQDVNAFAFFGGHIGVHSGLILLADNESELASVLAHEVSHVTQRHMARSILARQKASPLQIASLLGGILVAMASPDAGFAAIAAGNAGAAQASINYTRNNEREADRIGLQILVQAGFDPRGTASFFGKLSEKYRLKSKPPAFLMTHPLPESRVADARSRADSYPRMSVPPKLSFHLAKARIQARYYGDARHNISVFTDMLESERYVFKEAAQYGLALSYFEGEEYGKARSLIEDLLKKDNSNLFYMDTATDIAIAMEQYDRAIDLLEAQAKHTPRNRVLALNLANALSKKGQFERAAEIVKDYLLVNPEHLLSYQLLSDVYAESHKMLEMHQSKAEIYALVAAYPRAIDELHSAYTFAADKPLEKQRIRARIEQLRSAEDKLRSL